MYIIDFLEKLLRGMSNVLSIEELEDRINHMRMMLILIAKETGINSDDTLSCSRKLDELITMYQKINKN